MSFFDDARLRAKRRKSAWNLVLIPTIAIPWLGAWWYTVVALAHAYRFMHDGNSQLFPFWDSRNFRLLPPEGIAGIFVALGPLFAWLPVAMLFGNLLVRGFPPARRALDREAERVPCTDYQSAQRQLWRAAAVMFPAGMVVSLLGVFL